MLTVAALGGSFLIKLFLFTYMHGESNFEILTIYEIQLFEV